MHREEAARLRRARQSGRDPDQDQPRARPGAAGVEREPVQGPRPRRARSQDEGDHTDSGSTRAAGRREVMSSTRVADISSRARRRAPPSAPAPALMRCAGGSSARRARRRAAREPHHDRRGASSTASTPSRRPQPALGVYVSSRSTAAVDSRRSRCRLAAGEEVGSRPSVVGVREPALQQRRWRRPEKQPPYTLTARSPGPGSLRPGDPPGAHERHHSRARHGAGGGRLPRGPKRRVLQGRRDRRQQRRREEEQRGGPHRGVAQQRQHEAREPGCTMNPGRTLTPA